MDLTPAQQRAQRRLDQRMMTPTQRARWRRSTPRAARWK